MGSRMTSLRLDPVAEQALNKLIEAWQVYDEQGRANKSEAIRRAIVYAYLVYIKGVDPVKASADLEQYIFDELLRLGYDAVRTGTRSLPKKRVPRIWG